MASKSITYIWKVARPKDEAVARALMYAAYKTAIQTDRNASEVLIRSYVHETTRTSRGWKRDAPHVTLSIKNPDTAHKKRHETSHGYTANAKSFNVIRVSPSGLIKDDSAADTWPSEMSTRPKESYVGEPALLGPKDEFITWPSEETGV